MNRRTGIAIFVGLLSLGIVMLVMGDKALPLLIGDIFGVIVAVLTGLALIKLIDRIWP